MTNYHTKYPLEGRAYAEAHARMFATIPVV